MENLVTRRVFEFEREIVTKHFEVLSPRLVAILDANAISLDLQNLAPRGRLTEFNPFVSLPKALVYARIIAPDVLDCGFSAADAADLWTMRPDSSALGQRLSALKQYGLLCDSGRGAERTFELTPLARMCKGCCLAKYAQCVFGGFRPKVDRGSPEI